MVLVLRRLIVATAVALLLSALMTWPLVPRLGSASRIDSGDGRHGVWNVAWVAHALVTHPAALFNANIFYPHLRTLAYSEANFVAGVAAIPVWLVTRNPYAAYNTVILFAFAASVLSCFLLVRVLDGSRFGAAVAGLTYGFSPYMFAHIPHIQLLMTFGPALSMAVMHHFLRAPSVQRGALLGASLALTGLACAYYGIFAALAIGVGLTWHMLVGRSFLDGPFWKGVTAAAIVVALTVGPFFLPYMSVRELGFGRTLDDARLFSAGVSSYLASAAHAHRWMLPLLGQWSEVLFPGYLATLLAFGAVVAAVKSQAALPRAIVGLYVVIGALAFWASFGPSAGLYIVLFKTVPAFSFLRAASRFGLLVILAVAVLAGLGVTWLERRRWKAWPPIAITMLVLVVVESYVGPLQLNAAPRVESAYRRLALMPRAPVAEFPFWAGAANRHRQTDYMLASTFHWQPLINGYSDHMPADFYAALPALQTFPSPEAWEVLRARQVRWIVVHFDAYPPEVGPVLRPQLRAMTDHLRLVVDEYPVSLYEVIWPKPSRPSPHP